MKKLSFVLVALLLLIVSACSSQGSGGSSAFPTKNIEFIAPASPGGGWDLTARSMQKVLEEKNLVDKPINVVNKPGGSGEVGWKYLKTKDAHTLSINSSLIITNNLLGHSKLTYEDFTPIAILTTEWSSIAVPKDSKIKSAKEVMEKLKEDPKSLKIGVAPGLGNDDHLSIVQAAKTYGVDVTKLDFLVYESGGDVVTALAGGHVDVATMSVSEAKQQYLAGKINILAVTSAERIEGLEKVPTWKEEGVDMVFPHWRGVMGPPNMSEEEIAYWDEKIGAMVETDEWKQILKNNEWESFYKDSAETKKFLKSETEKYADLLQSSGLTK
ncbi:MAG TPA: tripartite tricarboxylate transporter substrate binding protein [Bacillales bacterium]|nr:tripartite tricarboxylate transporter substrate binding protein [Bacillales bacterium]